jgi:hypothetical protein
MQLMQRLPNTIVAGVLAATPSLIAPSGWAAHDPDVTDDESKCQLGTSLALGKFVTDKAKCITKCEQGARKALNPFTDCHAPFAGATLACVQRAESKAEGLEQSRCAKDCPECYTGGDCVADSAARVADAEAQVDLLTPLVFCDDSGSGDGLTAAEAKCMDTAAKTLSNFAKKKLNCYAKCRKAEHKGTTPPGTCLPATEEKAAACILKEETKAAFLIDKKCDAATNPKAEKPECHGAQTGATWAGLVETAVDTGQPSLYCGSPSGAFLD